MGLKEQLEALKSKSNPEGLCLVGLWQSQLPKDEADSLGEVLGDFGISSADILKAIGTTVAFKRTTLTVHRRGECSCQN